MARKSSKPVSIKAARKKKQETRIYYPLPEGDDWKPDGWSSAWDIILSKLYQVMLDRIAIEEKQAA